MNKIALTIALIFGFTIANAQDTTCTYFDGYRYKDILKSKDNVYFTPRGATRVSVGKPKLMIKL